MKSCRNFRNERARSTLLDHYLMFWCVSYYLGAFGTVCCVTTLSSKRAKLVQKFVPHSRIGIFLSECTRSTPLDSKLMFWISFVQFGCILDRLFPFKTQCKTGRTGTKVCATKSRHNFSQRTHLIDPVGI